MTTLPESLRNPNREREEDPVSRYVRPKNALYNNEDGFGSNSEKPFNSIPTFSIRVRGKAKTWRMG